jgi:protein-L-isoaspartate O-methyltransferase
LSNLVNTVYSAEEDKTVYDLSMRNVKNSKLTNIKFFSSDYKQLNIPELKFDKIIINGSVNGDPVNLLDKLKINGKLICILKVESSSNIYLYNKKISGYEKLKITNASSPILINYIDKEEFSF